uniref:Neutral ceramidase n=1 Tax=Mesocestoides corti TaxID=53468 RepID=A0A5K3FEN8_MESCO
MDFSCCVLFFVCLFCLPRIPCGFYIGVGKYDITGPVVNVAFMGYANPLQIGQGLHLRLYSRAFVIQSSQNEKPLVFINLDAGMSSQVLKTEVVRMLQAEFGRDLFTHANVMISATHTHSTPGGFFQYLLFDVTTRGFSNTTFNAMTRGILQSVKLAYQSRTEGKILVASGILSNASINRSPLAYLQNPENERKRYSSDVDLTMTLLKFVANDGTELGMINWFPVHCTSMNGSNRLVSSDNKGLASIMFEQWKTGRPANGTFVAAFAQSNEGDVSPNTKGARCIDSGLECDALTSTCNGRVQKCIAFGPGKDMFESTQLIARRQFEKAKELYAMAKTELINSVDFRHQFVDMTSVTVHYPPDGHQGNLTGRTCKPALGYSFAAGTTDGPGIAEFKQGMLKGTVFWNFISYLLAKPSKDMIKCHAPKPILLATGLLNFPLPWHPNIVETQAFQIGQLVIVGLPGEFTTMSGRRIIRATSHVLPNGTQLVLAGLSNLYTHYVTTFEEYQIQRYEGASTIFGPHTLQAYIEQFTKLAQSLVNKDQLPPGPSPPFLLDKLFGLPSPLLYDSHPPFHRFGSVWTPPNDVYHDPNEVVEASFVSGDPRNNLRTNRTYLVVEKRLPSGQWKAAFSDSDWETKFSWRRVIGFLPLWFHVVEVQWSLRSLSGECEPGTYRIRHFGTANVFGHGMLEFSGETKPFKVLC